MSNRPVLQSPPVCVMVVTVVVVMPRPGCVTTGSATAGTLLDVRRSSLTVAKPPGSSSRNADAEALVPESPGLKLFFFFYESVLV